MMTRRPVLIAALLAITGPVSAQEVPSALSLAEAIEIARTTNPGFLQTRNDEALADWNVRQSYGQLMPTANASAGVSWQGSGEQQFGSITLGDLGFGDLPSYYGSNYGINLGYSLSWASIVGPKQAKANRSATMGGIGIAESNLIAQVTSGYVEILRQEHGARIAELQLENTQFNLRLAQGQLEVGQVTPIDVGQAEVLVGRSEVTLLQRRNAVTTSRMRLLQLLGLPVTQPFETTTTFVLAEPTYDLQILTAMALDANPTLVQRRYSTEAAAVGVSSAWSGYIPTLSIGTGWSGFTNQASSTDLQIAQAQATVAGSIQQCYL
ncbi:MAG: TolC family protein, partial [Longimicrobiales bacterium]